MSVRGLHTTLVMLLGLACVAGARPARAGTPIPPGAAEAVASGRVDVNDPKVRERLKAAGVDPDELQSLMNAAPGATPNLATPAAPDAASNGSFPPVTTPPAAVPVVQDTLEAAKTATDSAAAAVYSASASPPLSK